MATTNEQQQTTDTGPRGPKVRNPTRREVAAAAARRAARVALGNPGPRARMRQWEAVRRSGHPQPPKAGVRERARVVGEREREAAAARWAEMQKSANAVAVEATP